MNYRRALRYLAPNLITTASVLLGMMSLALAHRGEFEWAAWMIIYASLTDRLDGLVARTVHGASEFGVQLDSFADFLNFGLAPAFLVFASLGESTSLPFQDGAARYLLMAACALWVLAAAFRLARFNITSDATGAPLPMKVFFGVPTTLAGGTLMIWYLALYKYGPVGPPGAPFPALPHAIGGPRLLGDVETPLAVWRYFPVAMFLFAYLMVSSLPMPKLGKFRSRAFAVFVLTSTAIGIVCGVLRVFPEYMVYPPTSWLVVFLIWGQLSPAARRAVPSPVFPRDSGPHRAEPGHGDADGEDGAGVDDSAPPPRRA